MPTQRTVTIIAILGLLAFILGQAATLHVHPFERRAEARTVTVQDLPTAETLPKDDGEARILDAIAQAREGQRFANVSDDDGRLLRQLTEAINAQHVVELGTSTGESGLWFSLALRKTGGRLHTFDIDPDRLAVARENFRKAGVADLITIHEGDAHVEAPKLTEPIDLLFLDAEKEGYDAYLRELLPRVRPGGLILAHNMRRPTPNPRYLEAITSDPNLDTSFLLMDGAGMGLTLKKR
ncbi:O-methyltransferase [Tautonia rosea]|uniref:O-methyltransferase n=1 Tax=Tautonia rosea TaxID=2728037 RepID=UPI001473437A|nr:class I SAM-dependent methyltransferase [Tautonia rosea]